MDSREPAERERGEPVRRREATLTAARIARRAVAYMAEMTGRKPEGVIGLERVEVVTSISTRAEGTN